MRLKDGVRKSERRSCSIWLADGPHQESSRKPWHSSVHQMRRGTLRGIVSFSGGMQYSPAREINENTWDQS